MSKATTVFYRYTWRRVEIFHTLKITPLLISLSQPVRLGLLSASIIQDRRDDPVEPRKGIYNTLDIGLAQRAFGSQRDFLRLLARNATYHAIGKSLRWRAAPASAISTRSTSRAIRSTRSRCRSVSSVAAAPVTGASMKTRPARATSPPGFPLGGTALLFNQTELRFPLIGENIGGVAFHDLGNIYSSWSNFPCGRPSATCRTSTTWCTRLGSASAIGRRSVPSAWNSPIASTHLIHRVQDGQSARPD